MIDVVDKRVLNKHRYIQSRRYFIERVQRHIDDQYNDIIKDKKIRDLFKSKQKFKIKEKDLIDEPEFGYNYDTGNYDRVLPNNESFNVGDKIKKPQEGLGSGGNSGGDGEVEDDFVFSVSKQEFLELFFDDLALPYYIRESLQQDVNMVRQRAGYSKDGPPPRLDLKKTFETSLARKIASKDSDELPAFLCDEDLRYRYYTKKPEPVKRAVMFCLMDVSGSMGEKERLISKKFFTLLYLFLNSLYEHIDLVFIAYHNVATELSEEEFFTCTETGGTLVSTALQLVCDIKKERYADPSWNYYVGNVSDGGNFFSDVNDYLNLLDEILSFTNYFFYTEVILGWESGHCLFDLHRERGIDERKNFSQRILKNSQNVYSLFRKFFNRETG